MNGRKLPRVPRLCSNPVALAMAQAAKPTAGDLDAVLAPITHALAHLRQGVATETEWATLRANVVVSLAIEQHGVVRGLSGHLQAASQALHHIGLRGLASGAWCPPPPPHMQEIEQLNDWLWLYREQLSRLSRGEVLRAVDQGESTVRSNGVPGVPPHLVRDRGLQARQLDLIGVPA